MILKKYGNRVALRNIENKMHVLFDCDNYYTFQQDRFKNITTLDNIQLDSDNKLQKL